MDADSKPFTFYTNPMSRGQIARWALHEAGVDYRQVILDYGTTMKAADYLAINPMGKVPAVVHHLASGDRIITECAAICAYLADTCADAALAPLPGERADYYRMLFFAAGPIESAVTNRSMGFETPGDKAMMAGYGSYEQAVDVLDQLLARGAYVCGERFTMADVYVGSQVLWGVQFGSLPERASFRAYADRLQGRAAYQAAKAIDNALMPPMPAG